MSQQQVSIIGAGLAGLLLGRCLLHRGISAILYEKDARKPRHGYGITLRASAYRQLLPILGLDESSFIKRVAVDGTVGGHGADPSSHGGSPSFRANRQKFEALLSEGLDIRWEYKVKSIKPSTNAISLEFENNDKQQQKVQSQTVIGADGVHSQIRKTISPSTDFTIHPFAVFNGKRRLTVESWKSHYEPHMKYATVLTHQTPTPALLQVSLNESTADDKASISYTYSRAAKDSSDALFSPRRPKSAATDITPELFEEVRGLGELPEPFKTVFEPEAMRDDRLLNWLMRSILVPEKDLDDAAGRGIALMGDAVHGGPILGSEGANEAIEDALALVGYLAEKKDLRGYYQEKYSTWKDSVQDGEARLRDMHKPARSNL